MDEGCEERVGASELPWPISGCCSGGWEEVLGPVDRRINIEASFVCDIYLDKDISLLMYSISQQCYTILSF